MGDNEGRHIDPNTDWFKWVHDEYNIANGIVSGDFPEDGIDYLTRFRQDHQLAKEMGLNTYRLGIEWSRIFPTPTRDIDVDVEVKNGEYIDKVKIDDTDIEKLDKRANTTYVDLYREIINDLRERGFRVIICLNHFTLPLWIHDPITARKTRLKEGALGWLDNQTVVEFTKYAAYIAYKFGDLIDYWATFNEPMIVAETGYLKMERFPPYYRDMGFPPRLGNSAFAKAVKNIIYAHVNAYEAVKRWDTEIADDDSKSPSYVGLIHNMMPIQPYRKDNEMDILAAAFMSHIHNKYILEAVVNGWLDKNFNMIKERGEIIPRIKGHLDWLGINYYCRVVVKGKLRLLARILSGLPAFLDPVAGYGFMAGELKTDLSIDGYPITDIGWEIYPEGLKETIDLANKYTNQILITENGLADKQDKYRATFIVTHLKTLEEIIENKKVNILGYLHWALTDNYEWAHGFKMKFGLYAVDLKTKERIPRPSTKAYKAIVLRNDVPHELLSKYKLK